MIPFLSNFPILPIPPSFMGKIWSPSPFSENFETSNPTFIKGRGSNYGITKYLSSNQDLLFSWKTKVQKKRRGLAAVEICSFFVFCFSKITVTYMPYGTKYLRMNQVTFFKGCLPQILLSPFLNTLPPKSSFLDQPMPCHSSSP